MDTFPSPPPKEGSREPSVSYRTIAKRGFGPPIPISPATTILPSGWIVTAKPSSSAGVRSVRTMPSPPNVGSRSPGAVRAAGAVAKTSARPVMNGSTVRRRMDRTLGRWRTGGQPQTHRCGGPQGSLHRPGLDPGCMPHGRNRMDSTIERSSTLSFAGVPGKSWVRTIIRNPSTSMTQIPHRLFGPCAKIPGSKGRQS